jgi:predicted amidohydrolase
VTSPLRVALVQLAIRDGDPAANAQRASELIRAAPPADVYLLPELWTSGYAHDTWPATADESTPGICAALAALSAELGAVVGGSQIARNAQGRLVNRFFLFHADGRACTTYDKSHLFAPMREPGWLTPGDKRVRVRVGDWTAALSICFDLRFPEMYRLDAVDGADLFFIVAEWPAVRREALRALAVARAIENQAFVVLVNRTGEAADGTQFGGGSVVIGPDGSVRADAGDGEGVVVGRVDRESLHAMRSTLEVLGVRRAGVDFPMPVHPRG